MILFAVCQMASTDCPNGPTFGNSGMINVSSFLKSMYDVFPSILRESGLHPSKPAKRFMHF